VENDRIPEERGGLKLRLKELDPALHSREPTQKGPRRGKAVATTHKKKRVKEASCAMWGVGGPRKRLKNRWVLSCRAEHCGKEAGRVLLSFARDGPARKRMIVVVNIVEGNYCSGEKKGNRGTQSRLPLKATKGGKKTSGHFRPERGWGGGNESYDQGGYKSHTKRVKPSAFQKLCLKKDKPWVSNLPVRSLSGRKFKQNWARRARTEDMLILSLNKEGEKKKKRETEPVRSGAKKEKGQEKSRQMEDLGKGTEGLTEWTMGGK